MLTLNDALEMMLDHHFEYIRFVFPVDGFRIMNGFKIMNESRLSHLNTPYPSFSLPPSV